MGIRERKLKDLQARGAFIRDTARSMFLSDGYLGLNMDRLAEAVEYSKPTIYSHFSTKEDLLLAIANDALRQRSELFQRATTFAGLSRERLTAIGVADLVFYYRYREHYGVEKLVMSHGLWEKASSEQREDHWRLGRATMGTMEGLAGIAVADGDLDPRRTHPRSIAEGLRSLSMGTHMASSAAYCAESDTVAAHLALRRNQALFLDGCGWKPLLDDWNWPATLQRIFDEIFPQEVEALPAPLRDTRDGAGFHVK